MEEAVDVSGAFAGLLLNMVDINLYVNYVNINGKGRPYVRDLIFRRCVLQLASQQTVLGEKSAEH